MTDALSNRLFDDIALGETASLQRVLTRANSGQAVAKQDRAEAWRLTGGRFDPTVLPALTAAGYDRSFEHFAVNNVASHN